MRDTFEPMRIGIGCVVLFLVGCGGGGSDSAVDKCDDLVDEVCDRAVECVPSSGTHAECVAEAQTALSCEDAQSVTAKYSTCLSQVRTNSCDALFPNDQLVLPADCNGVILIGE